MGTFPRGVITSPPKSVAPEKSPKRAAKLRPRMSGTWAEAGPARQARATNAKSREQGVRTQDSMGSCLLSGIRIRLEVGEACPMAENGSRNVGKNRAVRRAKATESRPRQTFWRPSGGQRQSLQETCQ